jgi:hypothetical protein
MAGLKDKLGFFVSKRFDSPMQSEVQETKAGDER